MKSHIFITLSFITSLVFGLPIEEFKSLYDKDGLENVHSVANSASIADLTNFESQEFHTFKQELSNVFKFEPSNEYEVGDDVILIPKSSFNERFLNSLGLKDIVKYSKKFKLSNVGGSHDLSSSSSSSKLLEIIIPESTVPYFIFNTSDSLNFPQLNSRLEYSKFLDHSAPFQLPEFSSLVDYFLILPIPERFNTKSLLNKEVVSTSLQKLSTFHSFGSKPMLVFLFKSGNSVAEAKELSLPLLGIKNYLGSKDLNSFFDLFATSWIEDIGFEQLIHGVFCTLNIFNTKESFCLKIKEDLANLVIYPAYHNSDKSEVQEVSSNSIGNVVSKRDFKKTNVGDDKDFMEFTLPLSILQGTNETQDLDNYSPRSKSYSQVISNMKSGLRNPIADDKSKTRVKRNTPEKEYTRANVEDIREKLHARLKQKHLKDKKIKDSKDTFVVSKFSRPEVSEDELINTRKSIIKSNVQTGRIPHTSSNFAEENKKEVENWVNQRQQKTVNEIKVTSTRSNQHRLDDPKYKEYDEPKKDCEPITWFNVFHHSISGKVKFCEV